MARSKFRSLRLSDKDLDFLVETASPGVIDKPKLKQIIREDEKFRNTFIDDEKEGRKFYRLAAEHPSAKELDLSDVFWTLHEDFPKAKKPLNFIAEHYLRYRRYRFFG